MITQACIPHLIIHALYGFKQGCSSFMFLETAFLFLFPYFKQCCMVLINLDEISFIFIYIHICVFVCQTLCEVK
jgi:hypothetical protein